ncbi:hypothetical protein IQ241_19965 [Romeria aff. gracilis LEGE 07310]|uniref:Uncharacterized protein n=1 Tax=Vasconcelosia minhoensis LEGE 07310 TaxID=915328 RepID=A0A8J7ASJ3_9CYAN|nr:hypothetical protein [Romeria gracilis]MBE9079545.1 hypothetical protein [Romeria aff. gracilis LEGE 07310]
MNGTHLRLVYAPQGESSEYLTFPIQAMTEVAGAGDSGYSRDAAGGKSSV